MKQILLLASLAFPACMTAQTDVTTDYVKNASFFKLDNITLGYTFGLPKDMTLNLFGTVQNVCCASGYKGIDPEVFNGIDNNIWPRPRTYVVGLKFNF